MPVFVSPTPITTVAGPRTSGSSGRQSAPSIETHTGVRDVSPVATTAPTATNPPRQRTTDPTVANGSPLLSWRQLTPDQAAPAFGGNGVVKAAMATGDGIVDAVGAEGLAVGGEASDAGGDVSRIGGAVGEGVGAGAGEQAAIRTRRARTTAAVHRGS